MRKFSVAILLILILLVLTACSSGVQTGSSSQQSSTAQNTEQAQNNNQTSQNSSQSNQSSGQSKELNIAWIHSNAAAKSEQRAKAGFEKFLQEKGWKWNISYSDSKGSGANVASFLENAVQRKPDAIILSMADLRASQASIDEASKAGIPIITIDSGWTPGVIVDITSNNYLMSAKVSAYMIDRLGGHGNVILFKMAEHHGVRKRGEVLDVMIKENPGIKVLADHNIDYTNFYEDTLKTMEDYVTRFGDKIDAVWAGWDEPAMAAASVLQQHGLDKKVFVVGIDGHPDAVDEIAKGGAFSATVAQAFELMGQRAAEYINSIVVEKKPASEVVPSTTVYLQSPLITNKNIPAQGLLPWQGKDFYEQ
ncbi:MAG TPA: sugar ABC transporter substrate-binding protein [Thermoanaerobacterales bacterium]|nr:sugar ABC transporter substrate-binding protein [Thermoanaerobacterales bacterium]